MHCIGRGCIHVRGAFGFAPLKLHTGNLFFMCLDLGLTVPQCTLTPHHLLLQESASWSMVHVNLLSPHSSVRLGLNNSMGTSVAEWQRTVHWWRATNYHLPKGLVSIQHQTSSVCQSTIAVSGTILASLGRDYSPMAISVALLMNITHFSMDNHHLTLYFLGRSHTMLTPLANVPLEKTAVIGMVSDILTVFGFGYITTVHNRYFMSLECTSWLDWCQFYWLCGTVYDKETYQAGPPPPCPAPPPNYHPPVQPGTCRFNITSGNCNFFPNTTGETM